MSAQPHRRQSRELALQVLFQMQQQGQTDVEPTLRLFQQNYAPAASAWPYACRIIRGVTEHLTDLDQWIQKSSAHWRLDRMPGVDLTILRIGAYEILHAQDEIPAKGAINEAVELAKVFSTGDSGKFINGVLDQLRKSSGTDEPT